MLVLGGTPVVHADQFDALRVHHGLAK